MEPQYIFVFILRHPNGSRNEVRKIMTKRDAIAYGTQKNDTHFIITEVYRLTVITADYHITNVDNLEEAELVYTAEGGMVEGVVWL